MIPKNGGRGFYAGGWRKSTSPRFLASLKKKKSPRGGVCKKKGFENKGGKYIRFCYKIALKKKNLQERYFSLIL